MLGLIGFYWVEVKPKFAKYREWQNLDEQKAAVEQMASALILARAQQQSSPDSQHRSPDDSVTLESLSQASRDFYDETELNRREGTLWVDDKSAKFVVTLGAVHGVLPGSRLSVYHKGQRIGYVAVSFSFDVISYVHPAQDFLFDINDKYLRVVIE